MNDADYREIVEELRQYDPDTGEYGVGLRAFVRMVGSPPSIARWSQWLNGDRPLSRQMQQRLLAAVGLPPLPEIIDDVLPEIEPDAEIVRATQNAINQVILANKDEQAQMQRNGNGKIQRVTGVTRRRRHNISVGKETFARLAKARQNSGKSWDDYLADLVGDA